MLQSLKELLDRRDLLYIIAWREIKVKYKQSVMGMLWAVLMPSVIVGAGFIVRFAFAKVSGNSLTFSELGVGRCQSGAVGFLRFGASLWHE